MWVGVVDYVVDLKRMKMKMKMRSVDDGVGVVGDVGDVGDDEHVGFGVAVMVSVVVGL